MIFFISFLCWSTYIFTSPKSPFLILYGNYNVIFILELISTMCMVTCFIYPPVLYLRQQPILFYRSLINSWSCRSSVEHLVLNSFEQLPMKPVTLLNSNKTSVQYVKTIRYYSKNWHAKTFLNSPQSHFACSKSVHH